jgi:hypothetical protein
MNTTHADTDDEIERHLSPRNFGALIDYSVPGVYSLERRGLIRGIRIGNRLRFPESAVREFLLRCADAPRRTPPSELIAAGGRPPKRGSRR